MFQKCLLIDLEKNTKIFTTCQWIMKNVMFDHRNSGFKFDFQNWYDHRLSKIQNVFGSIGNSVWKLPSFY